MNPPALLCIVCVGMLLSAEVRGAAGLRAVSKTAAALCMIAAALWAGASGSPAGRRIVLGLVLSAGGDVALLSSGPTGFVAGLTLFAAAHLAYAAAALSLGVSWGWTVGVALVLLPVARRVWRWLSPHVPSALRIPVLSYMAIISGMLALAFGASMAGTAPPRFAAGALLFFVSDLAVARERFVVGSVVNKLWGLPAYFGGQLLLATSL
ncbi:MAG: lysoplasmalogenase [Myxococcota bacterium]